MSLNAIQETLFQSIAGERALSDSSALIHDGALSAEDRLGIYGEMYWLRMRDTLRTDFPHLCHVLGDDDFDVLVARHLKCRPSTHYSLGRLGTAFSDTIREAQLDELPWAADLAALEWARAESFVALDAPVLEMKALQQLNADSFVQARLTANASVRLLQPNFDVLPLWRALENDEPWRNVEVPLTRDALVIWRKNFTVFHTPVSAAEGLALARTQAGAELGSVCEALDDATTAFRAISSWVTEEMMATLEVEGTTSFEV